jgi:hypothetical protein
VIGQGASLFRWSAGAALTLHATLLLTTRGVHGGADLTPHLRLIQHMAEDPAIRSVYPPAYHAIGALLLPLSGLAGYPEWFAFASAACLIFAFRGFQRAAGLPDASSALFAVSPYLFALTRCLPKVEVAGYAVALVGLALLMLSRRRVAADVALALCVLCAFFVHTAAALFLGLVGGAIALVRRDRNALLALGAGTLLALPLLAVHVSDGCSPAQALLFSRDDYLRAAPRAAGEIPWLRILLLAGPATLIAALVGAPRLLSRRRELLVVCTVILALYLNELWLAPFGARTTLDLLRGLTLLAIPTAICAGLALEGRPRAALALVGIGAATALATSVWLVPHTCVSKPVDVTQVANFEVDRCMFRWRRHAVRGRKPEPSGASERLQRLQLGPHAVVHGSAARQGATQQRDGLRDLAPHRVGGGDPA